MPPVVTMGCSVWATRTTRKGEGCSRRRDSSSRVTENTSNGTARVEDFDLVEQHAADGFPRQGTLPPMIQVEPIGARPARRGVAPTPRADGNGGAARPARRTNFPNPGRSSMPSLRLIRPR